MTPYEVREMIWIVIALIVGYGLHFKYGGVIDGGLFAVWTRLKALVGK